MLSISCSIREDNAAQSNVGSRDALQPQCLEFGMDAELFLNVHRDLCRSKRLTIHIQSLIFQPPGFCYLRHDGLQMVQGRVAARTACNDRPRYLFEISDPPPTEQLGPSPKQGRFPDLADQRSIECSMKRSPEPVTVGHPYPHTPNEQEQTTIVSPLRCLRIFSFCFSKNIQKMIRHSEAAVFRPMNESIQCTIGKP